MLAISSKLAPASLNWPWSCAMIARFVKVLQGDPVFLAQSLAGDGGRLFEEPGRFLDLTPEFQDRGLDLGRFERGLVGVAEESRAALVGPGRVDLGVVETPLVDAGASP